jgi:hypothetical protein
MAMLHIILRIVLLIIFLFNVTLVLLVTFWWLLPSDAQAQLNFPSMAGFGLFMIYISAFNRFPTQGRLLLRQNEFRYIHAPAIVISTVGFTLGFLLR